MSRRLQAAPARRLPQPPWRRRPGALKLPRCWCWCWPESTGKARTARRRRPPRCAAPGTPRPGRGGGAWWQPAGVLLPRSTPTRRTGASRRAPGRGAGSRAAPILHQAPRPYHSPQTLASDPGLLLIPAAFAARPPEERAPAPLVPNCEEREENYYEDQHKTHPDTSWRGNCSEEASSLRGATTQSGRPAQTRRRS
jgi:hypothetical protein